VLPRAPTHSPTTAPTTARVMPIFRPENSCGMACGSRTRRKICHSLACTERSRSSRLRSTELNPSAAVTTTGKKTISATTASFGVMPRPSQTTSSGAIATFGTACEATIRGYSALRAIVE
jgi:hypothetical protein